MALKEYTVDYCISYYGHMFEYFDNNDGTHKFQMFILRSIGIFMTL